MQYLKILKYDAITCERMFRCVQMCSDVFRCVQIVKVKSAQAVGIVVLINDHSADS